MGRQAMIVGGVVLWVGLVAAVGVAIAGEPGTELELVEVSPSVVMALNSRGSNITCFALDDGLVFVDTGLGTARARRFRAAMEERFERPARALVLTHAHLDHFLAMAAFADVEVIASAASRALFQRQLAIDFSDPQAVAAYAGIFPTFAEDIAEATLTMPDRWFERELVLGSGEGRLLVGVAGGHTAGSTFVLLESEGVIATGDLVQVGKVPYFGDPATDLEEWVHSLRGWYRRRPARLCPGHGAVVGREYLPPIWAYFERLLETVTRLKAEGRTFEEVVVHPDLPRGYWPEGLETPRWWPFCVARAYEQS